MDDILGHDCKFLQGPLSAPAIVGSINLALRHETEFAGEILNYRKDGSTFWNELTIAPLRNPQGVLTHIAEKIRERLAEPYLLQVSHDGGSEVMVAHHGSASVGVLVFNDNGSSQHDLLRWADVAMYQAKELGRNRVQFYAPGCGLP